MQIIELYIKTGGVNGTGVAFNVNTLIDFSVDFTDFDISVDDSIYFPDLDLTSSITSITSTNITISNNILTSSEITKYDINRHKKTQKHQVYDFLSLIENSLNQ